MKTNQIAQVSECGGKAKPQHSYRMPTKPPITGNVQIDHDNEDAYNDGVEWYNRIVAEFELTYPELPLTTPMPPNSTIMVESEPVWQFYNDHLQRWGIVQEVRKKVYENSFEVFESRFGNTPTRLSYRPITADQQSEGEKEKAFDDTVLLQTMNDTISEMHSDYEFQDKETPSPQPIPAKSASGETALDFVLKHEDSFAYLKEVSEPDVYDFYINVIATVANEYSQQQQSQTLQGVIEVIEGRLRAYAVSAQRNQMQDYAPVENELEYLLTQIKNLK